MRIVDKTLVNSYRNEPCIVCGASLNTVAHHVKTKKSGGHDIEMNLVPVCFEHHREWHDKGNTFMADKYKTVSVWFNVNNWIYCLTSKKYFNPLVYDSKSK